MNFPYPKPYSLSSSYNGISKSEFELEKLSQLAWEGIRSKTYQFSEDKIEHSGLKKESLNTVLTTRTKANTRLCLLHVEKVTYFSHLILQEFFSAVWLILFLSFDDFKNVLSVNDERFGNLDVVKLFIFGLCNPNTHKHLIHLPSSLLPKNANFKEKKLFLEQFVCQMAENLSLRSFPKCLEICSLLYEMQDEEVTRNVVQRFPAQLKMSSVYNIFPHDVSILCNVLQKRQDLLELIIVDATSNVS